MNTTALHEARRLAAHHAHLLSAERASLADLLRSLVDFEDRDLHRALGHASMFDYLHRTLRLSKGMAHYRLVACRLLRRFPEIEEPIRDGRLCTTTLIEVARVLKEENREVLSRFFGLSRQEAQQVAAEIAPALVVPRRTVVSAVATAVASAVPMKLVPASGRSGSTIEPGTIGFGSTIEPATTSVGSTIEPAPPRPMVVPLTERESRLHITVSPKFLELLKKAKAGESHRNPGASDEQVLVAALEALLEKQAKRKASVPAKVKRAVMQRDQARCQWPTADGGICGATTQLQIDHIEPRARGGRDTVDNCRVLCRAHNLEAARQAYGDEHIDRFAPRHPVAREEIAEYLAAVAREDFVEYAPTAASQRIFPSVVTSRPCSGRRPPPSAPSGCASRCSSSSPRGSSSSTTRARPWASRSTGAPETTSVPSTSVPWRPRPTSQAA